MLDPQVKTEHRDTLPEVSSTFHPAFGTFMVPGPGPNHMVLQPFGPSCEDPRGFSTQFMSPGDLSGYSFLTLSPINAVDPSLRGYGGIASPSPTRPNLGLRNLSNMPVCRLGTLVPSSDSGSQATIDQDPQHGGDSTTHSEDQYPHATTYHPRVNQTRKYTKRYQYWTEQEDNLVFSLRQRFGWTWKEISAELQRRLGGEHTWQAVQMRYLRTRKSRMPDGAAEDDVSARPRRVRGSPPVDESQNEIDDNSDYNNTAAKLEKAIQADWLGRWERIGAATGMELDSHEAKKALSNTKLPAAQRYFE